jgi:6,7-dimethyl-8-ribityllumazine synthase
MTGAAGAGDDAGGPTGGGRAAPATRVAVCVARFYAELADRLESGARGALEEARVAEIDRFEVPGAFELPLIAKYAARSGRYEAVVCLGAVIRGETDHYDHVCREAARGIQQVQLETGVPCGFGVLTVDTMAQALERVTGGSKRDTGRAAAEAALASLAVKDELGIAREPVAGR